MDCLFTSQVVQVFFGRFFVAMNSMLLLEAWGFPDSGLEGTQPNR